MGSLCSKAGTHTSEDVVVPGGQNRLGGPPRAIQSRTARPAPQKPAGRTSSQPHTLGGSSDEAPADPRAAAAEAAEQRMKAAQKRGVVANNPNRGKLAAQLEANKAAPRVPEPREEARLVWD